MLAPSEDLDFSDLKKKKKTSKKKAAFDLEAFEKELNESKAKDAEGEDADAGEEPQLQEIDEAELGDNPFAHEGEAASLDNGSEPWLKNDRDYTYAEVCLHLVSPVPYSIFFVLAVASFLWTTACL